MTIAGKDHQVVIGLMDQVATDIKVKNLTQTEAFDLQKHIDGKNASFARIDGGGGRFFSVNRAHVAYVAVERMK